MRIDWPTTRAALLTLFVVGNLLQAVPFPTKEVEDDKLETWRAPDVARWHGWLSSAGLYRGNGSQFQADVVKGYNLLNTAGAVIQGPSRPFFRFLRSTQQWGLFGVVTEVPERLLVEVQVGGEWRLIERRLDSAYAWKDDVFRYRRVRGTWDTVKADDKPTPHYEAFCRWTARQAFTDHAEAEKVRITREKVPVAAPYETLTVGIDQIHVREISRTDAQLWVLR